MDSERESSGRFGIMICAALLIALGIFIFIVIAWPAPGTKKASTGNGAKLKRLIDYTLTPISVTQNSEGQILIEVEVLKKDSWDWSYLSVKNIHLAGPQANAPAKLISTLPAEPVPKRFVLKFLSDPTEIKGTGSYLRFDLEIKASKYFGLSNAGSQGTKAISLEVVEPLEK